MANKQLVIALSSLCLAVPGVALADTFGGFTARGGKFMQSGQVCSPVRGDFDTPKCVAPSGKPAFALGLEQVGDKKLVEVRKKGTKLEVLAMDDGRRLFLWDSGEILTGVGKVYVDSTGCFVAVEYSLRLGGKTVSRSVVIALKKALQVGPQTMPSTGDPAQPNLGKPGDTGPTLVSAPVVVDLPPDFLKAMKSGVKWAARRKHSKAIASFNDALKLVPNQPEALYRLARSQYASKDSVATQKTLLKLSANKGQEGIKWRVEARFDKVFKALRPDPAFRKAVGIDRVPGEKISTYERLVSLGGKWEQEAMNCEQPRVNLSLLRNKKRRFDLVIRSECQGNRETTRLDGSWLASQEGKLQLRFPNTGANDEGLICNVEVCSDASGEDCLRCKPEPDLEFLLRVVRR